MINHESHLKSILETQRTLSNEIIDPNAVADTDETPGEAAPVE
jgi:hypothetical protein